MNITEVRELIPQSCINSFDSIVDGTVLGASNHIKMIIDMYVAVAAENDEQTAKRSIKIIGDYFKETRGKSSYAIVWALNNVERKIDNTVRENFSETVNTARELYNEETKDNLNKILLYTKRLLNQYSSVMLFDYSSTVEKAIVNAGKPLDVYIPESRVINGGYPFVKKIKEAGHHIHFIADAAMLVFLKKVDICFIGAETFYPDGTAFNTTGSDILAELCYQYHVPYYVLTPLLKCDMRALYGIYKEPLITDISHRLAAEWPEELKKDIDFKTIELVGVVPERITGYVTEKGIIKANDLYTIVTKEGE